MPASPNTETYTIGSELLSFSVDLIAVTPATGSVTVSHTVTYSDGSSLDSFIGYDIASSTVDFSVFSEDNNFAGTYTIKISISAQFFDSTTGLLVTSASESYTFTLEV